MADLTKYLLHHNERLYECIIVLFHDKGPKGISISDLKEYRYVLVWEGKENESFNQVKYEKVWANRWNVDKNPGHEVNFPISILRDITTLFIKEI